MRQTVTVLSYLFMLTHAVSCGLDSKGSAARFIVVNETHAAVDSLLIEPDERPGHWTLDPGDSMVYVSEMGNQPRVDGSYRLTYRIGKEVKELVFGYFSIGIPSERGTRVVLRSDTVLIRHSF